KNDLEELKEILRSHVKWTGSKKAQWILDSFEEYAPRFKKVIPVGYKRMLALIAKQEEKGLDPETAKINAFHEFVGQEA
ncbi:MAG: hypothetical protein IJT05_00150, partial [Lachnospiraceae bacterium]|nr:hypothetical protein [Lachnospiraceae bacterium]